MPLIIKNKVIGEKPPQKAESIISPQKARKIKITRLEDAEDIRDASLVVNGQKRKLSKNSAYLMDMVTLDEE